MSEIRFDNVCMSYGDFHALRDIDLTVREGEFLTLLGPSGCGKSTTLRLISGFARPTRGRILIGGEDVDGLSPQRRMIGMVFQDYALFPHLTVAENVGFGLRERKVKKADRVERVRELIHMVRLDGLENRHPDEISGGQRQRVALARALAFPPKVLLMDEPLGALDLKLREVMQAEIRRIHRETGVTTIYVTHDQSEAIFLSDRIAIMNGGRIEQLDTPESIYRYPATRFSANFMGRSNLLTGRVDDPCPRAPVVVFNTGAKVTCRPRDGLAAGQEVSVAIRPESIHMELEAGDRHGSVPAENSLGARIVAREFSGNIFRTTVLVEGEQELSVEMPSSSQFEAPAGTAIRVRWRIADASILTD